MDKITAPFTPEQVVRLNEFQQERKYHPFTCPSEHGDDWPAKERVLVATEKGWVCKECSYTQDWAHTFMAEDATPRPAEG